MSPPKHFNFPKAAPTFMQCDAYFILDEKKKNPSWLNFNHQSGNCIPSGKAAHSASLAAGPLDRHSAH